MKKKLIKKLIFALGISLIMFGYFAQQDEAKVKYKYKQYEKFDFDVIDVDSNRYSPVDLSFGRREVKEFKNKLPYRKNFNHEIYKGIGQIR